jgi:transcriptional regulator with XRE-family HTH domain
MDQDQGVGREVKRLREGRGWSQAKLAVEADMSVSGVSMIENGHRNLSTATLAKLAEAFGVEVRDLFPLAQAPLLDPSDEDPSRISYMKMPAAEFDAVRLAALTGEIDDTVLRATLLREYNAAEQTYKRLRESGASVENLELAKDYYAEAKKRWTVALLDDTETTIALDDQRDANVVEREDIRMLPLEEAYRQIRGFVRDRAGTR